MEQQNALGALIPLLKRFIVSHGTTARPQRTDPPIETIHGGGDPWGGLGEPLGIPWGSLGVPWGSLGVPWGSLGDPWTPARRGLIPS